MFISTDIIYELSDGLQIVLGAETINFLFLRLFLKFLWDFYSSSFSNEIFHFMIVFDIKRIRTNFQPQRLHMEPPSRVSFFR